MKRRTPMQAAKAALLEALAKVGCADATPIALVLWPPSDFIVLFRRDVTAYRSRSWAHMRVTGGDRAKVLRAIRRAFKGRA